ncbi:unnamed protein product [Rotaria sordida]|uniref:Uncharacterized protein n=1 Tax=Rotaria sordida TaxID=392033 RepID=A0A819S5T0_9BILA|nr:unnamed protein product [Rotaria sordida]
MVVYECDPSTVFPDDNNLPNNECDYANARNDGSELCRTNIATVWAIGGDVIEELPEEGGYPVGSDFDIKYYLLEMHYNNPRLISGRRDSSGVRFYVSPTLRQYDLGYLTFGTTANALAIAIPPNTAHFNVDSYCPAQATKNFPKDGITVTTAYAHAHNQGRSIWTKLIRNGTAIQYLFNTESFDFNYQFEHKLPKRIQLYPGDEFATRCVYSTENKSVITLGGEPSTSEMCTQIFMYYPRMNNIYSCLSAISNKSWSLMYNGSESLEVAKINQTTGLMKTIGIYPVGTFSVVMAYALKRRLYYNIIDSTLYSINIDTGGLDVNIEIPIDYTIYAINSKRLVFSSNHHHHSKTGN